VEREIVHEFKLTDRTKKIYRCIYCEHQASK
jgi:aspartate carbamoyltransferase regulatory subunit